MVGEIFLKPNGCLSGLCQLALAENNGAPFSTNAVGGLVALSWSLRQQRIGLFL